MLYDLASFIEHESAASILTTRYLGLEIETGQKCYGIQTRKAHVSAYQLLTFLTYF